MLTMCIPHRAAQFLYVVVKLCMSFHESQEESVLKIETPIAMSHAFGMIRILYF